MTSPAPTLASIPGILGRTVLRTFARIILAAGLLFLTITVALLACSLFVSTWRSTRTPKNQALVEFILAGVTLFKRDY